MPVDHTEPEGLQQLLVEGEGTESVDDCLDVEFCHAKRYGPGREEEGAGGEKTVSVG